MLVITGTGRCGTSLLAKFCQQMGYNLGTRAWWRHVNAGMEHPIAVRINQQLGAGKDSAELVEVAKSLPAVVKDPLFVLLGKRVLPWWHEQRPDARYLLLTRPIRHVAASIAASPQYFGKRRPGQVEQRRGAALEDFRRLAAELELPVRELRFPELLDDYPAVYDALSWGGLQFNREAGRATWDSLVDWSLVHHR